MKHLRLNNEISHWEKAYWYLRILVNVDRFGGVNKNPKKLVELSKATRELMREIGSPFTEDDLIKIKYFIRTQINSFSKTGTKKNEAYSNLSAELDKYFVSIKDIEVFLTIIDFVLLPTNEAIDAVPSSEAVEIAQEYAQEELDKKKESALANLIREWDVMTEELCLNREREILDDLIKNIRHNVFPIAGNDLDRVINSACQEFERRVGQKRKQRAGSDLESATDYIFRYFSLPSADGPMHFNAGIEVDNWLKDRKGWYIGISLKRTLRERWKQTATSESILTSFKIKFIVHLINNDQDLSDSKIAEMGSQRHLFFVADDSPVLRELKSHPALGAYLFPMSNLISKLKELTL